MFANHGRTKKYDHDLEGVNSRLDGLQAAILSVKLCHLPAWTDARRRWARMYSALLANTNVVTPTERPEVEAVYHLYVVRVQPHLRDEVQAFLQQRNIATGIHYPVALPNLSAYSYLGHRPSDFPEATRWSSEIISLPMYAELTEAEVAFVCENLTHVVSGRPVQPVNA
jgi:dTDP-4-amino-4,6-dideoxygalactose transaminase